MNEVVAPVKHKTDHAQDQYSQDFDMNPDDPTKQNKPKPKCMGCPDDKKLNKDLYTDALTSVAQQHNLNLNIPEERREAHMKILPLFRKRVQDNKRYERQDKEGPPMANGPEFVINENGIYYPQFQKSLQQMYEDQKRLRPERYDPKEHATMTMVEETLMRGAKLVKHVSHNIDSEGNEAIRDEIILRWDQAAKKGTMEIRNIALDGNFLSIENALQVMRRNSSGMSEVHPVNGVGIFSDSSLSSERVSTILSLHQIHGISDIPELITRDTVETVRYAGRKLQDDVGEMIVDMKNKYIMPPFLQRLLNNEEEKNEENITVLSKDQLDAIFAFTLPEEIKKTMSNEKSIVLWKKHIEHVIHVSPDQSEKVYQSFVKTEQIMRGVVDTISFTTDMNIAIGGSIALLDTFSTLRFEDVPEIQKQPVIDSLPAILHEEQGKEIVDAQSIQIRIEKANTIPEQHSEKKNTDDVVVFWLQEFVQSLDQKTPEEAIEKITVEHQRIEVYVQQVSHVMIEHLASEIQDDTVHEFSFAVMMWTMLKYSSCLVTLQSVKELLLSLHEKEVEKKQIAEGLIVKEPAPWILFSIIYYLAMIREQGMVQTSNVYPVQLQSQNISYMPIQQYAVIYPAIS
jgi:hypothetical protein